MDARTVASRLDEVQLVDVRTAEEWEVGRIEGAVNIPEDDLESRVDELDRTRPVITVCRAGTRSADAAEWLRGQGFDAQSLDGGMLSWKWEGLPLTGGISEPATPPGMSAEDMQTFHNQFMEVALAAQEHFGVGVEPTEAEMREFLRDRMIGEGKTPEEADAFMAELDGD